MAEGIKAPITSGCSKRPSSKAAASEEARRTLRYVEPLNDARTPLADTFSILLGFFDLDDRLALIRSAIQAGVMRQLDLVALGTDGHARRGDAQLLRAPLVAAFP